MEDCWTTQIPQTTVFFSFGIRKGDCWRCSKSLHHVVASPHPSFPSPVVACHGANSSSRDFLPIHRDSGLQGKKEHIVPPVALPDSLSVRARCSLAQAQVMAAASGQHPAAQTVGAEANKFVSPNVRPPASGF